jgi:hypothetical protein
MTGEKEKGNQADDRVKGKGKGDDKGKTLSFRVTG